ncbi:hypothetical protein V6N12_042472 [Hibiscus sabdariffa]|uniref:Reverse transcriptase zinc-binding domain-containing protein n=1 Tax=Hibiscus sabdariffa TaxID=183260 RepID=A0ABR2EEW4_9ROSI
MRMVSGGGIYLMVSYLMSYCFALRLLNPILEFLMIPLAGWESSIADFKGLLRVRCFLWLVGHERILTNADRTRRHLTCDSRCSICSVSKEDIDHALRHCLIASSVWNQIICMDGLLSAWSLHIQCLMVETDSLDAYCLIMEPDDVCGGSTLLPYTLDLISRPWEVRIHHVRRSGNVLADRMTKLASTSDLLVHRYIDLPPDCHGIIANEVSVEAATTVP